MRSTQLSINLLTRGLELYSYLRNFEELQALCDRIIVMSRGEIIKDFKRDEFDMKMIMKAAFRDGHEAEDEE